MILHSKEESRADEVTAQRGDPITLTLAVPRLDLSRAAGEVSFCGGR
jgi:hypothetical protein